MIPVIIAPTSPFARFSYVSKIFSVNQQAQATSPAESSGFSKIKIIFKNKNYFKLQLIQCRLIKNIFQKKGLFFYFAHPLHIFDFILQFKEIKFKYADFSALLLEVFHGKY